MTANSDQQGPDRWVEVVGRVVYASDNSVNALVAIDTKYLGDDTAHDYPTCLVEDVGLGTNLRSMKDVS